VIRGLMTDEEWAIFATLLTTPCSRGGRPPKNHRHRLDGILWICRTGAPWCDLPAVFGKWNSVWKQFRRWCEPGAWDLLLQALADSGGALDMLQMIDSTIVRAHRCAAGEKTEEPNQALGRSRGGLPHSWGSRCYSLWRVRIVGWLESLPEAGAESTIMNSATNLKQQIGAASRPPHLLTFVHPAVHQKIGRPFGDRGANLQSGTVPLGIVDQPVALAGQIAIQRVQGGP
jgi:transposase